MAEQQDDDEPFWVEPFWLREAARAACRAGGIDPDAMKMVPGSPNMRPAYEACLPQVRAAIDAYLAARGDAQADAMVYAGNKAAEAATATARREALEEVIAMADKVAAGQREMAQELMRRGEIPEGSAVADVPAKTTEVFRDAVRALLDKEPS